MAFDGRLLAGVSVLAAVVEGGSFVQAAEIIGLSASGVSRAVARLEARMGVRLLDRTTRSMQLTDEGRRFYEQVGPMLRDIEDAAKVASGAASAVRGRLRVDIDPFFAQLLLTERLAGFLERYPELSLELVTRDHAGNLIADGIDVAMRFGEPVQSSSIARKLLETRVLTVASPGYLRRYGRPKHPTDLARHTCVHFRDLATGRPFEWEFHKGRKVISVNTVGRLIVSDVGTMQSACVAGAGVAQVLALCVQDALDQGLLVDLFPDWPDETFPLYALYPPRHQPAAKVRAFIDFALEVVR